MARSCLTLDIRLAQLDSVVACDFAVAVAVAFSVAVAVAVAAAVAHTFLINDDHLNYYAAYSQEHVCVN